MKVPVQGGAIADMAMPREIAPASSDVDNPLNNDKQLIELLPVMVWTTTPSGHVNFVNLQCSAFTGVPREQLMATDMMSVMHPDDLAIHDEILQKMLHGRAAFEYEVRVRHHDGQYRRCLVRAIPDIDSAGEVTRWMGTSTDVEDLRQAADQIKLKEDHYRLALDAAQLGTWHHDFRNDEIHLDARACEHFGVSRAILNRAEFKACIEPADWQASSEDILPQPAQAKNNHRAVEFRVRRPDGDVRWLSSQISVEYSDEDQPRALRTISVSRDITAVKQAEARLRESEARLRRFAEHSDDALWLGDSDTMLPLYVSPAFERMFGRPLHNEFDNADTWLQSIHADDRKELEHLINTRYRTGFTVEFRIVRRDSSTIWARNRTFPIYDDRGELIHVGGIIEDITQRKQFEESLRLERERFDRVVAVVPGVLYSYRRISSEQGQYTYMTPGLAELHGVTNEDLANNAATVFRWVPAEDVRMARSTVAEACQRLVQWRMDYRVMHPMKGLRWLSINAVPVRDADDTVTMHGLVVDITARKQAEEQVQRLNADLELRVQQRTAELSAANEELESFAYAVSHDLRAPLRAMWGFCDALIEDYGAALPQEAREYLQHVIDGSRHLGEIIDGLLALSRSTRGDLRRDPIDISVMAEKILRDIARVEPQRRVTWAIQPGLRAYGDSRMIDAVLRNLLGNAWKYTALRAAGLIRVYAEFIDDEYFFFVEDNGAGFNMEHAEKLFLPFQRLHRQDEFQGLGIGLATVQRIVHRHGGKVHGSGIAGHGAKFCFSLPLPDDTATNLPVIEIQE